MVKGEQQNHHWRIALAPKCNVTEDRGGTGIYAKELHGGDVIRLVQKRPTFLITLRHPARFVANTTMELSEGNLAMLQATPSRSESPEIGEDIHIEDLMRECNAYARRLERIGRADCLVRQQLIFIEGRLRRADGTEIRKQMTTWQEIERLLAAEFEPLAINPVPKHKLQLCSGPAQLQQRKMDENHVMLTKRLELLLSGRGVGKPQCY